MTFLRQAMALMRRGPVSIWVLAELADGKEDIEALREAERCRLIRRVRLVDGDEGYVVDGIDIDACHGKAA